MSKLIFDVYDTNSSITDYPIDVAVQEEHETTEAQDYPPTNNVRLGEDTISLSYEEALDFAIKLAEVAIKGLAKNADRGQLFQIS